MKQARILLLPMALAATLILGACSGGSSDDRNVITPDMVSAMDSSAQWPFVSGINSVTVHCESGNELTITTDDGQYPDEYALNGLARQTGNYADIMTIWADDPDSPGLKINITPVTDLALADCQPS